MLEPKSETVIVDSILKECICYGPFNTLEEAKEFNKFLSVKIKETVQ